MKVHPIDYRYGSDKMRAIFSPEGRIKYMARVEVALAKALADYGVVPEEAVRAIETAAERISPEMVRRIEGEIKHETMALVRALSELAGDHGRYVHLGATSNDVLDTAMAMQLRDAGSIILAKACELLGAILDRIDESRGIVMLGRTHGVVADPITLAHKMAVWSSMVRRSISRFARALNEAVVGKMSGAVGTFASFKELGVKDPYEMQSKVMDILGVKAAELSTQVVPRDVLAGLIVSMSLFSSALELIANEIRNLHRTEIGELEEGFEDLQVGSSTMPHKRNPVGSEKVCGLARVMRSLAVSSLENVVLEHERDLRNSSAERCFIPEAFLLLEEQLITLTRVIRGLRVNRKRIEENLKRFSDIALSERIMLALFKKGLGRQEAHELVRRAYLKAHRTGRSLREVLAEDEVLGGLLSAEELDSLLEPKSYIGVSDWLAHEEVARARKLLEEVCGKIGDED